MIRGSPRTASRRTIDEPTRQEGAARIRLCCRHVEGQAATQRRRCCPGSRRRPWRWQSHGRPTPSSSETLNTPGREPPHCPRSLRAVLCVRENAPSQASSRSHTVSVVRSALSLDLPATSVPSVLTNWTRPSVPPQDRGAPIAGSSTGSSRRALSSLLNVSSCRSAHHRPRSILDGNDIIVTANREVRGRNAGSNGHPDLRTQFPSTCNSRRFTLFFLVLPVAPQFPNFLPAAKLVLQDFRASRHGRLLPGRLRNVSLKIHQISILLIYI